MNRTNIAAAPASIVIFDASGMLAWCRRIPARGLRPVAARRKPTRCCPDRHRIGGLYCAGSR